MEFFLNLVNFFGIFSEISPEIAIMPLQNPLYFGIIYLDLFTMSAFVKQRSVAPVRKNIAQNNLEGAELSAC